MSNAVSSKAMPVRDTSSTKKHLKSPRKGDLEAGTLADQRESLEAQGPTLCFYAFFLAHRTCYNN